MKYHQIISTLQGPLLILPASGAALLQLFAEHRALDIADFLAKREGTDICGAAVDLEQMEIIDGVAHIPVSGPVGRGLGKFEKGAGAVDYSDIADDLDQAEADPQVIGAILDIDSPGGMAAGLPELTDRILAFDKPIYSFSAGLMCSAAYWLGCAADAVFATQSATVANVGVYAAFLDMSAAYKAQGAKVDLFTSGKYKGMGFPGTALTKDHRHEMQARVDELAAMFKTHVQAMRPDVLDEDLQGQALFGHPAADRGFVDQVVSSKEDVVALLLS